MSKRPASLGADLRSRITGKAGRPQEFGLRVQLLSHLKVEPGCWEDGALAVGEHVEGELFTVKGTSAGLCFFRILEVENFLTSVVLTVRILGTTDGVFQKLILATCDDRLLKVHLCCHKGEKCPFQLPGQEMYHCRGVKLFPVGTLPHYGRNLTVTVSRAVAKPGAVPAETGDAHMRSLAELAQDMGAEVLEKSAGKPESHNLSAAEGPAKLVQGDKGEPVVPPVPPPLPPPPGLGSNEVRIKPSDIAEEVTIRSKQAHALQVQNKKKKKDKDRKKKKKKKKRHEQEENDEGRKKKGE